MPFATFLAVLATLAPYVQEPPAPSPAEPPPDAPCRLFGVFVDEAGAPVDGVALSISGWQGNAERAKRFGLPQNWQNPAPVTTGADGKFSLSFVPPRAFQFTLDANAPGLGRVGWRWGEIEPGKELDLGTVTLEPEAILVGHIVDAAGNLQIAGWNVSATLSSGARSARLGGRDSVMARATIDPTTGQFRIEGLPPGALQVRANSGTTRIDNVTVTTKKGEETFVELRYSGPDPGRRLVVMLRSRPFLGVRPEPGTVHAIAADGTRHMLTQVPTSTAEWHVPEIEPGDYRIEVRDPRFAPANQEGVRPGVPTTVSLVGSATLRLAVIDGETGAEVLEHHLDITYRNPGFASNVVRVRERSQPRPAGGSYAGILPGDLTLIVEAEGRPAARVNVDALAPDETRDVQVTLVRAVALRGRVVDTKGQPLSDIAVQVTRGAYPGHDRPGAGESISSTNVDGQQVRVRIGYRDAATTTAEDGSFVFEGLGPETHAVLALRGHWNDVWTTVELPRAEPLELTLPDAALAEVRLRLPDGELAEGLKLDLGTTQGQARDMVRMLRTTHLGDPWTCDKAGVFAARYLPVGAQTFEVIRDMEHESGAWHDTLLRHEAAITGPDVKALELDLRETFPVHVSLLTPAPAVEPEGFWMLQVRLKDEGGSSAISTRSMRGPDGKYQHSQWRMPGAYRIEVSAPGIEWSSPEPVQIVRGAANELDVDLPLVGRVLRVLGADGAPLVNTTVAYWTDSERRVVGTTDKDGKLAVVLLAGTLSIALPPQPDPAPEPAPEPALRGRAFRQPPTVDPTVLAGLTARATVALVPGETPLEVRLSAE
jgi:hypothetical protein